MCQLALGHYFLRAGLDPIDIRHDSAAFATALGTLHRRYGFDGILVNLPHTCGAIGDRLELMAKTGTDGIDMLDPPPLGTFDLADARTRVGPAMFIKGNLDPVSTALGGTPDACYRHAREGIRIAATGGGYILSAACTVPPHAPPEYIHALVRAVEEGP